MSAVEMLEDLTGKVDGLEDRLLSLLDRQDGSRDFRTADTPAAPLTPAAERFEAPTMLADGGQGSASLDRLAKLLDRASQPSGSSAVSKLPDAFPAPLTAHVGMDERQLPTVLPAGSSSGGGLDERQLPGLPVMSPQSESHAVAGVQGSQDRQDEVVRLLERIADGIAMLNTGGQSPQGQISTPGPQSGRSQPPAPQEERYPTPSSPSVTVTYRKAPRFGG